MRDYNSNNTAHDKTDESQMFVNATPVRMQIETDENPRTNICMTMQDLNMYNWYPNSPGNDLMQEFRPTFNQVYQQEKLTGRRSSGKDNTFNPWKEFKKLERQVNSAYSNDYKLSHSTKFSTNTKLDVNNKPMIKYFNGTLNNDYEPIPLPPNAMKNYGNMNSEAELNKYQLLKDYEEIEVAVSMITLETVYQTSNPFFRNPTPEEWAKRLKEVDEEFKKQYKYPDRAIWNTPLIPGNELKQPSGEPLHLFFNDDFNRWQTPPQAAEKTNNEAYKHNLEPNQINDAWEYPIPQEQVVDWLPEEEMNGELTNPMPKEWNVDAYKYPLLKGQINDAYYHMSQEQIYGNYFGEPKPEVKYFTEFNQNQPAFNSNNCHMQDTSPYFNCYELPPGQNLCPVQYQNLNMQSYPFNYPVETKYPCNINTKQSSNNSSIKKSEKDLKNWIPTSSKRSDWTQEAKTQKMDDKNNNNSNVKKTDLNVPILKETVPATSIKNLKILFKEPEHPKKLPQKYINKSITITKIQNKSANENSKKGTELINTQNRKLNKDIQQPKKQLEKNFNKGVLNVNTALPSGNFPKKSNTDPTNIKYQKFDKQCNEIANGKNKKSQKVDNATTNVKPNKSSNNKTNGKKSNNQKGKQKKK